MHHLSHRTDCRSNMFLIESTSTPESELFFRFFPTHQSQSSIIKRDSFERRSRHQRGWQVDSQDNHLKTNISKVNQARNEENQATWWIELNANQPSWSPSLFSLSDQFDSVFFFLTITFVSWLLFILDFSCWMSFLWSIQSRCLRQSNFRGHGPLGPFSKLSVLIHQRSYAFPIFRGL